MNPANSNPTGSAYRRPGVARHAARSEPDEFDDIEPPAPPEIRRSARVIQLILITLALAGVGTVAAFGGLERAGITHGIPSVPANQEVNAGIWKVTVESATAGTNLRKTTPQDGNYLIEIDATITNVGDRTDSFDGLLVLLGVEGLVDADPSRWLLIRDDRLSYFLHPGLTERMAFIWEVKGGAVPDTVKVGVTGTYVRLTNIRIFNELVEDHDPAATVTVPVTDRTATP